MKQPIGKQAITGDAAVHTLTLPSGTKGIMWESQVADSRYYMDGSTPSASAGHLLSTFQKEFFEDLNFTNFEIYVPTGATVVVSFFA